MAKMKAGTCPACADSVIASCAGRVAGWDWTTDPDGPLSHWARPVESKTVGEWTATEHETACGKKLTHVRRVVEGKPLG